MDVESLDLPFDPVTLIIVGVSLLLLFIILMVLAKGFKRVPIGAAGVVISAGRRTDSLRREGWTWLIPMMQSMTFFYLRERQMDVPLAQYYSRDRVRISFKTTLRVVVSDPVTLFDQGPGTYAPFQRDANQISTSGSEEENVALRRLVENTIRETVQSMDIASVMFGGAGQSVLRDEIQRGLRSTCGRWGLDVVEVWLTDVDAESSDMKSAIQSEAKEQMAGRGKLAAAGADIAKGALFASAAAEMQQQIQQMTGNLVPMEQLHEFLVSRYTNERQLDVQLKAAGTGGMAGLFMQGQLGGAPAAPAAAQPPALGLGQGPPAVPAPAALPAGGGPVCSSCGTVNDADSRFCDKCGNPLGGGAVPVPVAQPQPGGLPNGTWAIGREGAIMVDGDGVSRHHATLVIQSGAISIMDNGSTNGTYLRGQQLAPNAQYPADRADAVQFGNSVSMTVQQLLGMLGLS